MSAGQAEFKVSDQRHFAADGTPRASETESPRPAAEHPPGGTEGPAAPDAAQVDFASFILSLAAQASRLLHGDPSAGGEAEGHSADADGAQRIIAVLEMLQDKTEGRRTGEETRLLDGVLFELRMAYVATSQRGRP